MIETYSKQINCKAIMKSEAVKEYNSHMGGVYHVD